MLGFTTGDSIEPHAEWRGRIHPDDLATVEAADAACFSGATLRTQSEYRIRHRAGNWIWLRSDASVTQRDEQGRALRLVGAETDITALKEAESALRSSEERLRSAIENAPIGVALIDREGKWINVNEALFAFLGYSAEEFLELKVGELNRLDDVGLDHELIARIVAGEISDYQLEKRYLHKQGHAVWGAAQSLDRPR
ncbi:MAG: PAS domain S-box protein [Candidatus Devosia euplotis]|nr:PAS domain S-box protein [Candidatus Devosia euplotis]